jgi:hypothetical protein
MTPVETFLPAVRVIDEDAPETMVISSIVSGARQFATRSRVLTRTIKIDAQECVRDYPLDCIDEPEIDVVGITHVCLCGVTYYSSSAQSCSVQCGNGRFVQFSPSEKTLTFSFDPRVDAPDAISVRAVVAPTYKACSFDDVLYDKYREGVQASAIAKAFMILNPKGATFWEAQANEYIKEAVTERVVGFGGSGQAKMRANGFIAR